MITFNKYPAKVALANNPIIWKLLTDNLYVNAGALHQSNLILSAAVAVDQAISLKFANMVLTFTCKASPDNSGLQFRPKVTSETMTDYTTYLASVFNSNYYILTNYMVFNWFSGTDYILIMVSKVKGTLYAITSTANTTPFVLHQQTSGTDVVVNSYFSMLMQVLAYDNANFPQLIYEDLYPVDSNLMALADMQEAFNTTYSDMSSLFEVDFKLFPTITDFVIKRKLLCRYILRAAEFYGDNPTYKKLVTSTDCYALNGQLPIWKDVELLNEGSTWWDKLKYSKMFLNYCPDYKITDNSVQEFLYYIVFATETNASYNLKCKATFDDNTTQTSTLKTFTVNQYEAYELNVGLNLIKQSFSKTIVEYDIWIENNAALLISETRHFQVDEYEYAQKRIYFFRNSLGVMETIRFTGISSTSNKYDRITADIVTPIEFYTKFRSKKQVSVKNSDLVKSNSGWISKETVDYLQELLLSNEVYELEGTALMPIVITSTDFFRSKDDTKLYNVLIDYERGNAGSSYIPSVETLELHGDFNLDYNHDYNIDTI